MVSPLTRRPTINPVIRIHLDHNAGAPLDPRVLEAMFPWMESRHGNPSSLHFSGREARRAVEDSREEVAALLGGPADEIVFTSGATEANAAAVAAAGRRGAPARILVSAVEHPSVLEPAFDRRLSGDEVGILPVDAEGRIRLDALEVALARPADGVFAMAVNNEVGTIQPWEEIGSRCREAGVPFHCDAVQAAGKIPFAAGASGAATASLSAHKIGGPKGAGALWVRRGHAFRPLIRGGGQERGRRAGTENVPAIAGFGMACRLAREGLADRNAALRRAEEVFWEALRARVPIVVRHGPADPARRVPGTLSLRVPGLSGETLMIALDLKGVSVSLGSACSSGAAQPSHVLAAMGLHKVENLESCRVSFGWSHGDQELARAAELVAGVVDAKFKT